MSHFSFTRPLGVWNANTDLLAAEMADIDAKTFKAINGDQGGTWAPTSIITIGGSGLNVTGAFFVSATVAEITKSADIGSSPTDALNVYATSTFHASAGFVGISCTSLSANSAILCSGGGQFGSLLVSGATALGTLSTTGLANIASITTSGTISCAGTLTASGAASIGGALTVAGATQTNGSLTTAGNLNVANGATFTAGIAQFSGNARIARGMVMGPTSGGGTLSPAAASTYFFATGMSTQSCALGTTGVVDGDELEIVLQTGVNNTLTITGALGGSVTMKHFSAGDIWAVRFKWSGALSAWCPVSASVT